MSFSPGSFDFLFHVASSGSRRNYLIALGRGGSIEEQRLGDSMGAGEPGSSTFQLIRISGDPINLPRVRSQRGDR
jgi:hypothetical protein